MNRLQMRGRTCLHQPGMVRGAERMFSGRGSKPILVILTYRSTTPPVTEVGAWHAAWCEEPSLPQHRGGCATIVHSLMLYQTGKPCWLAIYRGIVRRAELRGAQVRPVAYVALSGDLPGFLPITELGAWILVSPIEEWAAVWERGGEGKRLSMSSP